MRVIQAYAREDEQIRRFGETNRALYDAHMSSVRVSVWYFGLVEWIGVAATGAVVGVGGWLVHHGTVSVGTVAAFVLLLASLFEPVQQLSQLFNTVQSAGAALHKLYDLLDTEPDVGEAVGRSRPAAVGCHRGRRRHVLLRRRAPAGPARRRRSPSRPASGSRWSVRPAPASRRWPSSWPGSTTRPAGSVRFGGVDLRRATMASLRERIVVVPQEGFLFGGTIRENIRLARAGATRRRGRGRGRGPSAPGSASRPSRTGSTPRCGSGARRLSAGERQLVSLARAALVDPAVLVLDEATSNLDPGTEAAVEGAMERLMQGRTMIVVAHRLSTVRRADRIAVVDHGRLVELGTHDELVAPCRAAATPRSPTPGPRASRTR